MKFKYGNILDGTEYSGSRRKKSRDEFSGIPNSAESRFLGLVLANNGDLSGRRNKNISRRRRTRICLDVLLAIFLVIIWILGYCFI